MDRFTILREDLDAMSAAGMPEHVIERVVLAMVRYGLDGQEPDFAPRSGDAVEITEAAMARVAFAMVKNRIDKYVAKSGNAKGKGTEESKPNETAPDEIETNRNESNEIETHKEKEKEQEYEQGKSVSSPDNVTHTGNPQQGTRRRARARPGWFDPAAPEGEDDGAWRQSEDARKAVAQRILRHVVGQGRLRNGITNTEAGVVGSGVFGALVAAMELGISPSECIRLADGMISTWEWELRLKARIVSQGGTERYPEWADQVAELREELMEREGTGVAYG